MERTFIGQPTYSGWRAAGVQTRKNTRKQEAKEIRTMKTALKWMMAFGFVVGMASMYADDKCEREGRRAEFKEMMKEKRTERREFMESIRDLPDNEKLTAIKAHMAEGHAKRTAVAKERHAEAKKRISEMLSKNENIPSESVDEFLQFIDGQMTENLEFREGMYEAEVVKLEAVFADGSVDGKSRNEAMKEFHKQMREKVKAHHESQREARRAKREELFGDLGLGARDGGRRGRCWDAEED
jgi:hypothetical protein